MKILRRLKVPTGDILVVEGQKGSLEMLSLGDYGKDVNLKADCLGLTRDIADVKHTKLLPFEEKWVITISTQYGCESYCSFCDVPKCNTIAFRPDMKVYGSLYKNRNATFNDLIQQVLIGAHLHPEVKFSKHLNIHFARMGEPTWNPNVLDAAKFFREHLYPEYKVHPVVSTMMPNNNEWLKTFIHNWMRLKNRLYEGNAGLQLSINSTNEKERFKMFSGNACTLPQIEKIMEGVVPFGRKITLNFAVADFEINPKVLLDYFNPEYYIIKLTPMHKTLKALENKIKTKGDYTTMYPYAEIEKSLKEAGYDVLVFIASKEEDLGRITCGNAILSGTLPEVPYEEVGEKL
jgi:23S rRNA (adenine2503-C2)-methyltransferase